MIWSPGDVALIDAPTTPDDLKYALIVRQYTDECGGHDYFYTDGVIPDAYVVRIINGKGTKDCLVAGKLLVDCDHPNRKINWQCCPFQPRELS